MKFSHGVSQNRGNLLMTSVMDLRSSVFYLPQLGRKRRDTKLRKIIFISAGGAAGAVLRFLVRGIRFSMYFPLGTLAVNVLGSFLLALILTVSMDRFKIHEDLRDGLTVGFMGAFTTFSSVCQESVTYLTDGRAAAAMVYIVITTALGMAAAFAGYRLAARHPDKRTDGE